MVFAVGTVGYMLTLMRGVWHDHINIYDLAGNPLAEDTKAGTSGKAPFDNLVYIDFDGESYMQTNVTFAGRPLHVRSFTGRLVDGVLHFDKLGENDPGHIGIAAGNNVLAFVPSVINDALKRYSEPDFLFLQPPFGRVRSTVLYRDGIAVRTLHAQGYKLSPDTSKRHSSDPRGTEGEVHAVRSTTDVYKEKSNV